jgi:hypothetical protein
MGNESVLACHYGSCQLFVVYGLHQTTLAVQAAFVKVLTDRNSREDSPQLGMNLEDLLDARHQTSTTAVPTNNDWLCRNYFLGSDFPVDVF